MGTRSTNNNKPNLTISDGHLLEYFRNTFRSTFGRTGGGAVSAVTQYSGTGGNEIVTYDGFKVHIFTSPGTFTISPGASVEYLVVAGGGAGARIGGAGPASAGGGAGGAIYSTATLGGSYSVTIGAGGVAPTSASPIYGWGFDPTMTGSPSSIVGLATATGGGHGGSYTGIAPGDFGGGSGGCGGGGAGPAGAGAGNTPPTSPIQGFPGGSPVSAGGGGTASPGRTGPSGRGGDGVTLAWGIPTSYGEADPKGNPAARTFGGGGGGWPAGVGGPGGGGDAVGVPGGVVNGLATSGGGGGAANPGSAPSGGSGIAIFRYRIYQ